jgi:hypothetical protein
LNLIEPDFFLALPVVPVSIQQAPAPGRYTIRATAGAVTLDASLTVV